MVRYWVIVPGFLLLAVVFSLVSSEEDLYRVLQVSRSASPREIKSSYRKLAKKWHPDKNQAPDAKDKFIHINRAYEILSNKEKRHHYDTTGSVEETLHGSHQSSHDGFTVFQSGNGFQFHFRFPGGGGSTRKDDSITAGMFFDQVLPKSDRTPYLIYFYHEFCFECMGVDNVWAELKRDLKPLGVGQGTVHTSFQPRVAQYCSVSRVPSIVGVVSGRVLHFNGHQYNSRSIKNFLKSILPANVITKLTSSNVDSFLSNAILRNRPRVVLFSRAPSPSLTYLLTALYLRKTLDFAYAPVGRGERDVALCTRFQVEEGERKLLVFKEDRAPVLVETITELSRRLLLDLLEDVTLYLQRISSPMMFDTICHLERPCALLVVEGTSQYNDSKAVAFREAAKKGGGSLSFSYIDASLQEDFLSTFKWSRTAESCDDGTTARKIILLKRLSSSVVKFKWIDQFCEQSLDDLPSHFSTIGFKITQMEKKILDEEAPVWYERLWIKLEEYYFSFTSATNMQSLTPMISLVFTGLMVCMMAALTGMRREEEEEEDRTKQRRQDHRKKLEKPEQTKSSRSSTCIYPLNQQNYATITDNPTKGMVTLVIFTDTSTTKHRDELLAAYENILRKHHYSNLQYFFLCYRSQSKWFENIMSCSSQLPQEEMNMRVRACASGGVATAVCLIGTKKQFLLYPENLGLVCELNRQGMEGDTEGVSGGSSEIGGLKKNKNPGQKKDVGETLGNIFGYESESEEDEDRFKFNGFSSNSTHKRHSAHKSGPNSSSHKSNPSFEDLSRHHELEEPSIRRHLRQIEQVDATFENWLERLADGSLQRYTLEVWPEWT